MPASQVAPTAHPSDLATSPAGCAGGAPAALYERPLESIDWAALVECLTPFVEKEAGRRRTTDGITSRDACRRTSEEIITTGSSTGLEDIGYACGISSLAMLAAVFLGDIYISGLRSVQLRHEGGAAGRVGGQGLACYTLFDTAGGIKEIAGATFRKGGWSSLGAKHRSEKTAPDAINYNLLPTSGIGYSSGFPDELLLIHNCRGPP